MLQWDQRNVSAFPSVLVDRMPPTWQREINLNAIFLDASSESRMMLKTGQLIAWPCRPANNTSAGTKPQAIFVQLKSSWPLLRPCTRSITAALGCGRLLGAFIAALPTATRVPRFVALSFDDPTRLLHHEVERNSGDASDLLAGIRQAASVCPGRPNLRLPRNGRATRVLAW